MSGQQLHRSPQQWYRQERGDSKNRSNIDIDDNDNDNDNDGDSLWDDDIDETPIATLPLPKLFPLSSCSSTTSSLSSSDDENDEHPLRKSHRHHGLEQDDLFEENGNVNDGSHSHSHNIDSYSRKSCPSGSNRSTIASEDDDDPSDSDTSEEPYATTSSVLEKIEEFVLQTVIEPLSEDPIPSVPELDVEVEAIGFKRKLSFNHLTQARSLTSIIMVASFCYDLLAPPAATDNKDENEDEDEDIYDTTNITTREEEGASGDEGEDRIQSERPRNNSNTTNTQPLLRKTTTTRELYYFYVTYFRDQRECDKAIWDLVRILNLPSRQSLGLVASPRGWFCGSIDVYNAHTNELKFNGRELDSHGMAITPSTYDNPYTDIDTENSNGRSGLQHNVNGIRIESDARCILVIEKEGIYTRLSEDKFFLRYFPCILVTGKGFPDIATRRWVWRMQRTLKIPVYGLCDCNPYGVSVLDTYRHHQGVKLSVDQNHQSHKTTKKKFCRNHKRSVDTNAEEEDAFEMEWIGLCPTQVETMGLPSEVFQELTSNDLKRLESLLVVPNAKTSGKSKSKSKPFAERGNLHHRAEKLRELRSMYKYKVELEALHWKGADYLSRFVYETVLSREESKSKSQNASKRQKQILLTHQYTSSRTSRSTQHTSDLDRNDGSDSHDSGDGDPIPETAASQGTCII